MVKIPTPKIYVCEKEHCGYDWLQRLETIRDDEGKIIRVKGMSKPKNCSKCKSSTWNVPPRIN